MARWGLFAKRRMSFQEDLVQAAREKCAQAGLARSWGSSQWEGLEYPSPGHLQPHEEKILLVFGHRIMAGAGGYGIFMSITNKSFPAARSPAMLRGLCGVTEALPLPVCKAMLS